MRLSVLDPQVTKEPENLFKAEVWIEALLPSLQDEEREEKLAAFFADLGCSKDAAPFVARGLIQHGRLRSTGSQTGSSQLGCTTGTSIRLLAPVWRA